MKFYSEVLDKFFDTEKDCVNAETESKRKQEAEAKEKEKLANERKARAKEIDEARNKLIKKKKHYNKLIDDFVKDYNSYHYSIVSSSEDGNFNELFDSIFRLF